MKADSEAIEWLLENATQYRIAKETGVAQGTISDLKNGKRKIENLTLKMASRLTNFSKKLQKQLDLVITS